MREIIQKVIETEGEAKRLLETARATAERMLVEAQQHAETLQAQGLNDARAEAEQLITLAVQEAEAEKAQSLSRAVLEVETQIQLEPTTRQQAIKAVLRCVCGSP